MKNYWTRALIDFGGKSHWHSGETHWLERVEDPRPATPFNRIQGIFLKHHRMAREVHLCCTRVRIAIPAAPLVIFRLAPTDRWEPVEPDFRAYAAWVRDNYLALEKIEQLTKEK